MTVSFGCELVVYDPQTSACRRLFVHVCVFDSELRNGDLTVPRVIKRQIGLCLLCLLLVLCVRLCCPGMLTCPRSQTRAVHSLSLVTLVARGGCLHQRATDENPPCSSCAFYLRVFRALVHRKHPPSLNRTAAPGSFLHKHAAAVRGARALSTRQEMRSLKLQKYINLESLKANKHHLECLLASRAPESN